MLTTAVFELAQVLPCYINW